MFTNAVSIIQARPGRLVQINDRQVPPRCEATHEHRIEPGPAKVELGHASTSFTLKHVNAV